MNRCKFFFKTMVVTTAFLLGSLALNSCKKHNPVVTLDNVVDTAPADKLKSAVTSATKLADLPPAFTAAAQTVINDNQSAALFDAVDFNAAAQFVQANSVITAAEVTKLRANDPYTLNAVITRMTSLPSYISESTVSAVYDNMLNNTELSTYVINPESSADPLYENDSYQCALDVQKLIRDYTIPMLQKLATLKAGSKKSASITTVYNRSGGVLSAGIWGFLIQLRLILIIRIHIGG